MNSPSPPAAPQSMWRAQNLLSVDDLSRDEIDYLLDLSAHYARFISAGEKPPEALAGKTQVNLFFEDSTRTNLSFELAGKKLGADVLNVPVSASSVNKGEDLIDTTQTLAAMGAHAMIVRHKQEGVHRTLAERIDCPIINGGDGAGEHPTQALLDAAAIRRAFGRVEGLTIAICGDIRHSRVAGSGALLLQRLGAEVRFVGPSDLMPADDFLPAAPRVPSLREGLDGADIAMGLRIQFERMTPSDAKGAGDDFFHTYGLTHETMKFAKPGARVMHPGPMNRGVEIDGALADDPDRSLILSQVFHGVPTRMAVLHAFITHAHGRSG